MSAFRTIITPTKVSVFEPAGTDGLDPYRAPADHARAITYCSDFGYYSVAHAEDTVVNHLAVAAQATAGGGTGIGATVSTFFDRTIATYVIATHNLGYVPQYKVSDETGAILSAARPVQIDPTYGTLIYRTVRTYATTTQIVLVDVAIGGEHGLAALTKTYKVRCFRAGPQAGEPGFLATPERVLLAHGAEDSDDVLLRVAKAGEDHMVKPMGRCSMPANGQMRFITADGETYDTCVVIGVGATATPSDQYTGNFAGPQLVDVVL